MTLEARMKIYIDYLMLKVDEQDWHGVADAAMDLREIAVEMSLQKQMGDMKKKLEQLTGVRE